MIFFKFKKELIIIKERSATILVWCSVTESLARPCWAQGNVRKFQKLRITLIILKIFLEIFSWKFSDSLQNIFHLKLAK